MRVSSKSFDDILYFYQNRKLSLFSSVLSDYVWTFTDNHYELYLMPKDKHLVSIFNLLTEKIKSAPNYSNMLAYIALRPTPGITKSNYNKKNMPRIITAFKPAVTKEQITQFITWFNAALKTWLTEEKIQDSSFNSIALNIAPRYSQKLNDLIYVGYGSPDYKDSKNGKTTYASKAKTWWQRWVSGASDDAMAYKNDTDRLDLQTNTVKSSSSKTASMYDKSYNIPPIPSTKDSKEVWMKFYEKVLTIRCVDLSSELCFNEDARRGSNLVNLLMNMIRNSYNGPLTIEQKIHDMALLIHRYKYGSVNPDEKSKLQNIIQRMDDVYTGVGRKYDKGKGREYLKQEEGVDTSFMGDYPDYMIQ